MRRLRRGPGRAGPGGQARAGGGAAFVLVTGNRGKAEEARRIVGAELEAVPLDLPEIQSLDLAEVLAAKGEEAWRRLGRPLVVDETGLGLAALGGFPGPLAKWMVEAVGAAGIARIAHALGDARAEARCALLYLDGERRVTAEARVPGTICAAPRGDGGFGWDPVFVPRGEERTYAELPAAVKDEIGHRGRAWRQLLARVQVGG